MKLNKKVLLFLLGFTLITLISIGIALGTVKNTDKELENMVTTETEYLTATQDIYALGLQRGQAVRNVILNPEDKKAKENFDIAQKESIKLYDIILPIAEKKGQASEFKKLKELTAQDITLQQEAIRIAETDKSRALEIIVEKETPVWREIKDLQKKVENEVVLGFKDKKEETSKKIALNEKIIYLFAIIFMTLAVFFHYYINKIIIKPVKTVAIELGKIAGGDFTSTSSMKVQSKDEIGVLVTSMNKMSTNIKQLLLQISETSEQVAAASEQLSASAEQSTSATNEISNSIQTMADGNEKTLEGSQVVSNTMYEISQGVIEISNAISNVNDSSMVTTDEARRGNEVVQETIEQIETVQKSIHYSSDIIKELGILSSQIDEIVKVITDISSQTNLLSLNASIEAARAGEHGKGFAVVANEVKKLANESKVSGEKITNLVSKIQDSTSKAIESMETSKKEMKDGSTAIIKTGEAFKKILESAEYVSSKAEDVASSSEQISASVQEVTSNAEQMTVIAQDSSSFSQNIAASSEEQLASMEEISSSAQSLAKLAEELNHQLSKFKI